MSSNVAARVLEYLASTTAVGPPTGLFAVDAVTWHSFDEVEAPTVPDTVASLAAIRAVMPDFTMFDIRAVDVSATLGLAQYTITGTLPDASTLWAPAAMVIHVDDDGRAVRLEEYVDSGQLARLFAAL